MTSYNHAVGTLQYASVLLSFFLLNSISQAYVTSPGAVPHSRKMAFLKQVTFDLCQTESRLSVTQLSQAPQLLHAWSQTARDIHAPQACERLVARIMQEKRAGNDRADLTVQDYNKLLETWLKSGDTSLAAERCEQIVHGMQSEGPLPNLESFQLLLTAWRKVPSDPSYAPHRASRILEWMIRLYESGENPNALPDAECFDTVLTIWSRSGHLEAPERTEELLGAMQRLHRSGVPGVAPRHYSFNAVLAAWAKSDRPEAADRALSILSFMEVLASRGELSPDAASYNTVMNVVLWVPNLAEAAVKAQAILKHALQAQERDDKFALETILFNSAMGAWAKSKTPGAFVKARAVLERQQALYDSGCLTCAPDVVGYTSVLACCASEKVEKSAAFETAMQTFEDMRVSPNHITYGTLLKACGRLLPAASQNRRKAVRRIFEQAKAEGCVGEMAISRMREATPELYRELMDGHNKKSMPHEWSCNVIERKKKRRRAEV